MITILADIGKLSLGGFVSYINFFQLSIIPNFDTTQKVVGLLVGVATLLFLILRCWEKFIDIKNRDK